MGPSWPFVCIRGGGQPGSALPACMIRRREKIAGWTTCKNSFCTATRQATALACTHVQDELACGVAGSQEAVRLGKIEMQDVLTLIFCSISGQHNHCVILSLSPDGAIPHAHAATESRPFLAKSCGPWEPPWDRLRPPRDSHFLIRQSQSRSHPFRTVLTQCRNARRVAKPLEIVRAVGTPVGSAEDPKGFALPNCVDDLVCRRSSPFVVRRWILAKKTQVPLASRNDG